MSLHQTDFYVANVTITSHGDESYVYLVRMHSEPKIFYWCGGDGMWTRCRWDEEPMTPQAMIQNHAVVESIVRDETFEFLLEEMVMDYKWYLTKRYGRW